MKLYNNYSTDIEDDDVCIEQFTIKYTQDLNSCQSRDDFDEDSQTLTLTTDDAGGGKFIHMNIGKSGWSINPEEINDFIKILNHFKKIITLEP